MWLDGALTGLPPDKHSFKPAIHFTDKLNILEREKYANRDKDIVTSKLFTVDELIEDKLSGAHLSNDEEVIPFSFKDAMDSTAKL
ncbi:hypothetical protein AVEN_151695-1 [Araneus ventricosus]|uniref:Uncharacterized protein n=1 Tax=Araneus ventricosus TaxID=182803 RepID=A0A4Y2MU10_ARAVE|nr:hypothetical protein AVEN_151695-1 [Araneus ventricosus]